MSQIHILANRQPLRILIRQNRPPRSLGFADDISRPRLVKKTVMDARRVPRVDALRAAERCVAHERVPAAVVVACIVMRAEVIFLFTLCQSTHRT